MTKELTKQITQLNKNLEKIISLLSPEQNEVKTKVINKPVANPVHILAGLIPSNLFSEELSGLKISNVDNCQVVDLLESHPDSTCFSKVKYNPEARELYVTWKSSNTTYAYRDVDSNLYRQFITSNSLGRFHYKNIRNKQFLVMGQLS